MKSNELDVMTMQKLLTNKKYAGILYAVFFACAFVLISLWGTRVFSGISWYVFSSFLRLTFGFVILYVAKRVYGNSIKSVLSFKGSKSALVAGIGFIVFLIYYIILWCSGIKFYKGITAGLLISRIILQQIATGFYEELNFRYLVLEGYFYGKPTIINKLIYGFISFLLFGAVHVIGGWNTFRFLQTGVIGFSFAVIYLKSRNIIIPMLLHFIYDVFANLVEYFEWNNSMPFVKMNSIYFIMLIIMFVISVIMLFVKDKHITDNTASA